MSFGFEIPAREMANFESAIKEYYQATGKDAAYVVNRQALNVAIKAAQNTPSADKGAIEGVTRRPWWPKLVAKVMMSGKQIKVGRGKKRRTITAAVSGHYTRAEARQVSKKMIGNRVKKAGFIRSGWSPAIKRLSAEKLKLKGQAAGTPAFTRNEGKAPGDVVIAQPGISPTAEIINKATGAEKVAGPALISAYGLAAADMRGYVAETYGETARKFSAK